VKKAKEFEVRKILRRMKQAGDDAKPGEQEAPRRV
jgi:hypothetical protein